MYESGEWGKEIEIEEKPGREVCASHTCSEARGREKGRRSRQTIALNEFTYRISGISTALSMATLQLGGRKVNIRNKQTRTI